MNIYYNTTAGGKNVILEFVDDLPKDEMVDGYRVLEELESNRLDGLVTRQIAGKLW